MCISNLFIVSVVNSNSSLSMFIEIVANIWLSFLSSKVTRFLLDGFTCFPFLSQQLLNLSCSTISHYFLYNKSTTLPFHRVNVRQFMDEN